MPVYFKAGPEPPNPVVVKIPNCRDCIVVGPYSEPIKDLVFDTDHDARMVAKKFGQHILELGVSEAWAAIWRGAECPDKCGQAHPCGDDPDEVVYWDIRSEQINVGADVKWQLYVTITRRLECVKAGPGLHRDEDVKPVIPKFKNGKAVK